MAPEWEKKDSLPLEMTHEDVKIKFKKHSELRDKIDYSQLEVYTAAVIAHENKMLEAMGYAVDYPFIDEAYMRKDKMHIYYVDEIHYVDEKSAYVPYVENKRSNNNGEVTVENYKGKFRYSAKSKNGERFSGVEITEQLAFNKGFQRLLAKSRRF